MPQLVRLIWWEPSTFRASIGPILLRKTDRTKQRFCVAHRHENGWNFDDGEIRPRKRPIEFLPTHPSRFTFHYSSTLSPPTCHLFLDQFLTQLEIRLLSASIGLRSMKVSNVISVSSPSLHARSPPAALTMPQLGR